MTKPDYSHLTIIETPDELKLYDLVPNPIWVFDLDKHGWWWGNTEAIKFWGLETVDDLINKDLSGDTDGARKRMEQTFDLAVKEGLTVDPWTTYPNGKPKTLFMKHRAALLGPERHRGIIAYIHEDVNLGEQPENLLLVEAMRYTTVMVTSFTLEGESVIENPAATEAYKHLNDVSYEEDVTDFTARFETHEEGLACFKRAREEEGGRWEYRMRTSAGIRTHMLDIRMTRHPLTGDFLVLMAEYDVTPLKIALEEARLAEAELHMLAHYDALTGLPSLRLFQENVTKLMALASRENEKLAVMFIDLDGFKDVNDTYGHDIGDAVLKAVADRLKSCIRDADIVSRIGGDEFILLQTGVKDMDAVSALAEKITDSFVPKIDIKGQKVTIGASVGVALYPDHGADSEKLIREADQRMYTVKKSGKNNYLIAS
ncbi:diguanylate cyclase domain-containing protein [Curvivirga sp.]|uniref:diguanylate cyclase domain-containing protein n=1 Tax=Curvivirga sp. TaxID=2856848 RepID=UPI003B597DE7